MGSIYIIEMDHINTTSCVTLIWNIIETVITRSELIVLIVQIHYFCSQ